MWKVKIVVGYKEIEVEYDRLIDAVWLVEEMAERSTEPIKFEIVKIKEETKEGEEA